MQDWGLKKKGGWGSGEKNLAHESQHLELSLYYKVQSDRMGSTWREGRQGTHQPGVPWTGSNGEPHPLSPGQVRSPGSAGVFRPKSSI